jgi:hypothetical protein
VRLEPVAIFGGDTALQAADVVLQEVEHAPLLGKALRALGIAEVHVREDAVVHLQRVVDRDVRLIGAAIRDHAQRLLAFDAHAEFKRRKPAVAADPVRDLLIDRDAIRPARRPARTGEAAGHQRAAGEHRARAFHVRPAGLVNARDTELILDGRVHVHALEHHQLALVVLERREDRRQRGERRVAGIARREEPFGDRAVRGEDTDEALARNARVLAERGGVAPDRAS